MGRMVEYIEKFYMDDTGKIYHEGRTGEVIRCKDCKYWNGSGKYCDYEMSGLENDFCSWAKRKEE